MSSLPHRLLNLSRGVQRLGSGELKLEIAECRLKCNFCSHGLAKRVRRARATPGPPQLGPLLGLRGRIFQDWIRRRVVEELAQLPRSEDPVALGGWDPLEYDDIGALVHLVRRAGRKVRIVSPGLRLAERPFVRELAHLAPEFSLTYLSTQAARYEAMTALPGAKDLVERAMVNLLGERLRFAVNVVLTSENCHELTEMADLLFDDLGITSLTFLAVLPDVSHLGLDPQFTWKLPDYRLVGEEVARCVSRHGPRGRDLALWNIPPCRIPPSTLATGRLAFTPVARDAAHPIQGAESCLACAYQERCSQVSPAYLERFPADVFDPGVVAPFASRLLTGRGWSREVQPPPGKTSPRRRDARPASERTRPGPSPRGVARPARRTGPALEGSTSTKNGGGRR